MMIYRMMYRGIWKDGMEAEGLQTLKQDQEALRLVRDGVLMTAAAFSWRNNVFLYVECIGKITEPLAVAGAVNGYLTDWPGEARSRKWIPLVDVFHFNEPADAEHWRRQSPVERRVGRVAHLKREMMASYIYYHYQLQEERAFNGPKYEMIGMHENLLFGYQEFPGVVEPPVVPGRLETKGTPEPWEKSRMDLHFQPWEEDGYLYFKPVETVYAYYIGDLG
ncbi:hypothetical protein [Paenibacillus tengchongensis]|uniref:hypothetical protein n=1 Tax=Paenibacillus tengchongensis TaxID=2608684 RepID=UPI00124C4A0E|nr:hypothetical protein [Paenibacillus tengchongensis]